MRKRRVKEGGWGGARAGAGRKGLDIARRVSAKLEREHAQQLDALRKREELADDSAALRWLLDRDRTLAARRKARAL